MSMFVRSLLREEERRVDPELGYPRGYAKLCRNAHIQMQGLITPYTDGPPQRFLPYLLEPEEIAKLNEFNQLFPITESDERAPSSARRFADSLWQQLDHLGNAGFDPDKFRVDPYGNVLYKTADPASPLAWEVDHWFPHSRGGKTVVSNLRLVQWQVNKRKRNKLEFLVPWWDLQLGVSVNQFLSIFASKNSDFRQRAFSLLFFAGENEALNDLLVADSHSWPQHFRETKSQIGLAPAAIVRVHKQANDNLKPLNGDPSLYPAWPVASGGTPSRRRWTIEEEAALHRAVKKFGPGNWKEIKESEPLFRNRSTVQIKDKYRLIKGDWEQEKENRGDDLSDKEFILSRAVQKESRLKKIIEDEIRVKEEEIVRLNEELKELQEQNEAERLALEDLESILIKHRRRVEKQRQWSEAQYSYRMCLENMIKDAMHQNTVYKEQGRLNQTACNALMARLETQKVTSDASEMELIKSLKHREDLETLLQPHSEQTRRKIYEDGTASCPKKNIKMKMEEIQSSCHLANECTDSAIIAANGVKEESDTFETQKSSLPSLQCTEECSKISQVLDLYPEEKHAENKSNLSMVAEKEKFKEEMETTEVEPVLSIRSLAKTAATKEKPIFSEAESDLDVLIVGYEYTGARARATETESVGENMSFATSSDFKHSKYEGWSKEDCASRIGENDGMNKQCKIEEEDRAFEAEEDNQLDGMLGEIETATSDATAKEGVEDDDERIKKDSEPENNNLSAIHDNFIATQVCESKNMLGGLMRDLSFGQQIPHHKRAPIGGSKQKEYSMHPNPCTEEQGANSLDLAEKFKSLQLACDVKNNEEPQNYLDARPGTDILPEGNDIAITENPGAEMEIKIKTRTMVQEVVYNRGARCDDGINVRYEKTELNNCDQLKDVQRVVEMPLKGNAHYTHEITEPEQINIRSNNGDNYVTMNLKGQEANTSGTIVRKNSGSGLQRKEKESRLKRSESAGFLSSLWGQTKGRNMVLGQAVQSKEEGKLKEAKCTEEDDQQGVALLKNGLSSSIKTCTHMWNKAIKKLEGVTVGTDQDRND